MARVGPTLFGRLRSWSRSTLCQVRHALGRMSRPPANSQVRRRRLAAVVALLAVVALVAVVLTRGGGEGPQRLVPGGGEKAGEYDPLAYDSGREDELVQRATTGLSDVVYEKSPGGVVATA